MDKEHSMKHFIIRLKLQPLPVVCEGDQVGWPNLEQGFDGAGRKVKALYTIKVIRRASFNRQYIEP